MATGVKKGAEDDSGEFADFMADISHEIAKRVESLDSTPKSRPAQKKEATPVPDRGVILEWENVADRMIEEMG
ncbi:MAG TPA: hypothetical protein VHE82_05215 [Gemmatimonadaceae bacterium]|nr:hypothetical protein [Gemmatimonadaceae bacterium]